MKRTLIAAAVVAAASGSAFAHEHGMRHDPYIFNSTVVNEDVGIRGFVALFGCASVNGTVGAVVDNNQSVWANVKLDPPPSSYVKGAITTTIDNHYASVDGGGHAWSSSWSSASGSSHASASEHESSSYSYGRHGSSSSGYGYQFSHQDASLSGNFDKSQQSAGGHVSAGGHAGFEYSYASFDTPHYGFGGAHIGGGFSAGYHESSYSESSGLHGSLNADEGSGSGSRWNFYNASGSGHESASEYASESAHWSSNERKDRGAAWAFGETIDSKNVSTYGSVTTYIDTQQPGELNATTGSGAGNGISGNVGINITEGIDNAQSNDASLATVDTGNVFGNAQIFNAQASHGKVRIDNFMLNASVGDNALQNVSGNVGVNVSSGAANVQNNSLAAATTQLNPGDAVTVAMAATDQTSQTAGLDFHGSISGTAMLGAGALARSTGNIGVNIAGGAGNLQHNGLAIAAAGAH